MNDYMLMGDNPQVDVKNKENIIKTKTNNAEISNVLQITRPWFFTARGAKVVMTRRACSS